MRTKPIFYFLGFFMLGTIMYACNSNPNQESSTEVAEERNEGISDDLEDESEFLIEAASGGLYEVEAAKLAQQKATSQEIKDLAAKIEADHSQANQKLQALATSKGIAIPSTLGDEEQKKLDELNKEEVSDFDEDYMEQMVKDHKSDVDAFEKAAKNLDDPDVKSFASTVLPTLKEHLNMAEQMEDKKDM